MVKFQLVLLSILALGGYHWYIGLVDGIPAYKVTMDRILSMIGA